MIAFDFLCSYLNVTVSKVFSGLRRGVSKVPTRSSSREERFNVAQVPDGAEGMGVGACGEPHLGAQSSKSCS